MKNLLLLAAQNKHLPKHFSAKATEAKDAVNIHMYGIFDADFGLNAADLVAALPEGDTPVNIFLNSPGGDVFEARAMAALIARHAGPVTMTVDGLAASAATYFALSGSKVQATEGSLFMVHNSWTWTFGNKHDLTTTAQLLDKVDGTIAADYARKTGASAEQIAAWMDAETWFSAQEALDNKFLDAILPSSQTGIADRAKWNLSAYKNAPKIASPKDEGPTVEQLISQQRNRNVARAALLEFSV